MEEPDESGQKIRVLGLSGSLRKGSLNTALLGAAAEIAPPHLEIQQFPLSRLPFYNQDLEADGPPRSVHAFRAALQDADALLIATPEYNFTTSAVIKNAIEWGSRPHRESPLKGKPVAVMGATPGRSGTARAQAQLRQMLAEPGAVVLEHPEVLVDGASKKFDRQRRLTDPATAGRIRELLDALVELVRRLGHSPAAPAKPIGLRQVS